MSKEETVNGYTFELVDNEFYQCRGDVCYDDEHDEVPEEGLWDAACKLARQLNNQGVDAAVEHSEKGWVEVWIIN
mgnify:CR=1 FL=1|jgi:hypothetical protein